MSRHARPLAWMLLAVAMSHGDDLRAAPSSTEQGQSPPQRPAIAPHRWQEDWSVLDDPRLPRAPGDALKYIPLSATQPKSYLSFGLTVRERAVNADPRLFGTEGGHQQSYLLHRLEFHADAHLTARTRVFMQLENALAPGLREPGPADANRLDLRLLFIDTQQPLGNGVLKLRAGRQEMAFDLKRFVSVRNGPNVRQAFDALWGAYSWGDWLVGGFASQPVQYRNRRTWDDISSRRQRFDGMRVERQLGGDDELSLSFSRLRERNVQAVAGAGRDVRRSVDLHYKGDAGHIDWDVEAMRQRGSLGGRRVAAWAVGALAGYTFDDARWHPRLGLQLDSASGDRDPTDRRVGTFNPLFPNGSYLNLSGYTGYTNFIHLKPSLTLIPRSDVTLVAAVGLLWRQTTNDAIYAQPNEPVPGTAGMRGRRSSTYTQFKLDWEATRSLSFALEWDRYFVAPALRRAGGRDSSYLGAEVNWAW